MNYDQLRIAMNAYNKRVQLEEAYKEGHSDAVNEQPRLGGFARQLKLMKLMGKYDTRTIRAMQQRMRNNAYRANVELISKFLRSSYLHPLLLLF